MTNLTTFFDKNEKLAVYTGVNIHGLYFYIETIGDPTTLTALGQLYNYFGT